jgi:hypothetical protein
MTTNSVADDNKAIDGALSPHFWVGDCVVTNIFLTVPAECAHAIIPSKCFRRAAIWRWDQNGAAILRFRSLGRSASPALVGSISSTLPHEGHAQSPDELSDVRNRHQVATVRSGPPFPSPTSA